ncbi:MAG: TetR/AcrR family transcriptional regulator [Acholeplasmataceae bacterium]
MQTTKDKIIDVVLSHIKSDSSISDLTLSKIATEANIGKSTVYEHFHSKEEIIIETYKHLLNNYEQILTSPIASEKFKEAFIEQLKKILIVMKDAKIIMDALLNQQQSAFMNIGDDIHKYASKIQERMNHRFIDIFEMGVKEGVISPLIAHPHKGRVIQALISGLIYQYVNDDFDVTEEALFELICEHVLLVLR